MEILRAWLRVIRRAQVPIKYSEGYSPHPKISLGSALSVGVASAAEYIDLRLSEQIEVDPLVEQINEAMPIDLMVLGAKRLPDNTPSLGSSISFVDYLFALEGNIEPDKLEGSKGDIEKVVANLAKEKAGAQFTAPEIVIVDSHSFTVRVPISVRVKDLCAGFSEISLFSSETLVVDRLRQWIGSGTTLADPLDI